jgi:Right handed beta helix region
LQYPDRQRCYAARSIILLLAACFPAATTRAADAERVPRIWRVDCDAPVSANEVSTLHSLTAVNALALQPGDQLLFRRGTVCRGKLSPKGSGSESRPIRISTFGSGARPRIEAAEKDESVVEFRDQQYFEIDSLDVSGASAYGIHITAGHGLLRHIVLRDLTVHHIHNQAADIRTKSKGLIVVHAIKSGAGFDDVLIDGVLAHDTTQWAGIVVEGFTGPVSTQHVVVRNSMVHDVHGDGIVLFRLNDGLIENSVAWHTGMQKTETVGTPNGIWAWACARCTIQNNEAFLTDSPGIDGGAFDIDFWNHDNSVLDNYAHDTQGYCVAVFGAYSVTTQSTVRGNVCIQNGLSPRLAERQGAIFLATWEHGSLRDVRIEQNTVYFDPPGNYAAFQTGPEFSAHGVEISHNRINTTSGLAIADKLQAGTNTVTNDAFPSGIVPKASEGPVPEWAKQIAAESSPNQWQLIAVLPGMSSSNPPRSMVGQLMLLRSQALQFRGKGLQVTIACHCSEQDRAQLEADWQLVADGVRIVQLPGPSPSVQSTILLARGRELHCEWEGLLKPSVIGPALRQVLGTPSFGSLPAF